MPVFGLSPVNSVLLCNLSCNFSMLTSDAHSFGTRPRVGSSGGIFGAVILSVARPLLYGTGRWQVLQLVSPETGVTASRLASVVPVLLSTARTRISGNGFHL